ncbi:MAG TPA: hypothetical protein VLT59_08965, partial [Steroidobacteraceae bacterium]|nr:hypothetical protein [Steroidobacteraceae bacterium]
MDVIDAMSAGAAGGLLGLLSAMLIAPFVRPAAPSAGAPADSYAIRTTQIVLTLLAAAMLGALYWLSWGLAAVVNVPWWFRGITFAL